MNRLTRPATILALALVASAEAQQADRFAAVEVQAQHVSGTVHMLVGAGGNIGVSVGEDGTMIIDDQFAPLADKITAALKGLGGDKPRLVLNTHYHGDHTGSNPYFGQTGTIIAHDNVRVRLLAGEDIPRSALPLVTYDDDLNIHFNDEQIEENRREAIDWYVFVRDACLQNREGAVRDGQALSEEEEEDLYDFEE